MIHRYYKDGKKLDVAGLNQITVIIDRSETELAETSFGELQPNSIVPPQKHNDKEQIFYVTSGEGNIKIGGQEYKAKEGSLAYMPAGTIYQIINTGKESLIYMLFNIHDPEKNIQSDKKVIPAKYFSNIQNGPKYEFGSNSTILLLDRKETNRCELTLVSWPAGNKGALVAHKEKEQTFFVLNGKGWVTIANETEKVKPGDVIFVPRNTPHTTEATDVELSYLCMNALPGEIQDESFDEMYKRVASARIKRWKSGSKEVGE